jgi:hypothetical protein
MKGHHKKFSKKLFDENDPKSRKLVKEFFAKHGILLEDNNDQFGVDLVSLDGTVKIEIERRTVWKNKIFPFSEINLPERKAKFFTEKNVAYVIISDDYSRIGFIKGSRIKEYITEDNLKENPNKYVAKGELFYKIPKDKFKWLKL